MQRKHERSAFGALAALAVTIVAFASLYGLIARAAGPVVNMSAVTGTDVMLQQQEPDLLAHINTYVSVQTGSDITGTGTMDNPFKTIVRGISETVSGGTVHVAQGTYASSLSLDKEVDLIAGYVVVDGTVDWNRRVLKEGATTVDAGATGTVLVITGDNAPLVEGFTLVNGHTFLDGGGVEVNSGAAPTLRFNWILNNTADLSGGGIYIGGSGTLTPTVVGNTIAGNTTNRPDGGGGGIHVNDREALIQGNVVTNNSANNGFGGGILLTGHTNADLVDNDVAENMASIAGGGICVNDDAWPTLRGNLVRNNTSSITGGGIYVDGSGVQTVSISGNTIAGNVSDGFWQAGGGLYIDGRPALVRHNLITQNMASGGAGAGVFLTGTVDVQFVDNDVISNTATIEGGGIAVYGDAWPTIYNNRILDNTTGLTGGGIYVGGVGGFAGVLTPTIVSNTISGNIANSPTGGGAGIHVNNRPCVVQHNLVADNRSKRPGGGVLLTGTTTAQVSANSITGNTASDGGGLAVYGGAWRQEDQGPRSTSEGGRGMERGIRPILIEGNLVTGNYARSGTGGGLFITENTDAQAIDNDITGNSAAISGGGVSIYGTAWPTLRGNRIQSNESASGGGMFIASLGPRAATVIGNTIAGNVATSRAGGGGGIQVNGGPALIQGNLITGNAASYNMGGGILFSENTNAEVVENDITDNTAPSGGGGVFVFSEAWPTLQSNRILNNTAGTGGGIHITGTGSQVPSVIGNTIDGNVATSASTGGGAIYVSRRAALISGNLISGNQASQGRGGGLNLSNGTTAQVLGNRILGNEAGLQGGGVWVRSSGVVLANNLVRENLAPGQGSAIAIVACSPDVIHNTLIGRTSDGGTGLYIGVVSQPVVKNNIVAGFAVGVSCTSRLTISYSVFYNTTDLKRCTSQNNLHAEPRLADDVHLLPDSPAVDRGVATNVSSDIDGQTRPYGPAFDIGADEYQP